MYMEDDTYCEVDSRTFGHRTPTSPATVPGNRSARQLPAPRMSNPLVREPLPKAQTIRPLPPAPNIAAIDDAPETNGPTPPPPLPARDPNKASTELSEGKKPAISDKPKLPSLPKPKGKPAVKPKPRGVSPKPKPAVSPKPAVVLRANSNLEISQTDFMHELKMKQSRRSLSLEATSAGQSCTLGSPATDNQLDISSAVPAITPRESRTLPPRLKLRSRSISTGSLSSRSSSQMLIEEMPAPELSNPTAVADFQTILAQCADLAVRFRRLPLAPENGQGPPAIPLSSKPSLCPLSPGQQYTPTREPVPPITPDNSSAGSPAGELDEELYDVCANPGQDQSSHSHPDNVTSGKMSAKTNDDRQTDMWPIRHGEYVHAVGHQRHDPETDMAPMAGADGDGVEELQDEAIYELAVDVDVFLSPALDSLPPPAPILYDDMPTLNSTPPDDTYDSLEQVVQECEEFEEFEEIEEEMYEDPEETLLDMQHSTSTAGASQARGSDQRSVDPVQSRLDSTSSDSTLDRKARKMSKMAEKEKKKHVEKQKKMEKKQQKDLEKQRKVEVAEHKQLEKKIERQRESFKIGANEEYQFMAKAKFTCKSGPVDYLFYNGGEEFEVLRSSAGSGRKEGCWLVRRCLDGTYGLVESKNLMYIHEDVARSPRRSVVPDGS